LIKRWVSHIPGSVVELDEKLAERLVRDGFAEVVEEPSPAPERNKVARKLVHTKG
jgi:hypothetical protein